MSLRFRGLRLVDARRDEMGDLAIEGDRIVSVGKADAPDRVSGPLVDIDCAAGSGGRALVLMPAFVDLHVHFRDPGFPEKESLESGLLAAAAGGFGTVAAMANTRPVTDRASQAIALRSRALALGLADYFPVLAMTRGLEGKDLSHLEELSALRDDEAARGEGGGLASASYSIRMISDDGRDLASDEVMLAAMRKAAALGLAVACHCEIGPALVPPGSDAKSWYASEEGLAADRAAEIRGVERALRLARESDCAIHLCHLSTRESLDRVREAKYRQGHRVSCEVTPHHLCLAAAEARDAGAAGRGRVNPWLRTDDDRLAMAEALADGTIDAIATDHAPHGEADKEAGAPGFVGLETAFSLVHDRLCDPGENIRGATRGGRDGRSGEARIGLRRLSRLMSLNPARILGLPDRGLLEVGSRADLVLIDPGEEWLVDPGLFRSRGANSLLAGRALRGRVIMTIHEGRIVHERH